MDVVVGTYEEVLLGYKLLKDDKDSWSLQASFNDHSHAGCIKTVAMSENKILASGSSDESIRLFKLDSNVEFGSLVQHDGTITNIQFYKASHMFSCSEDGTVCLWKTTNWECLRTLKGHKGPVYCIAVHPSGKLALTVGKDCTLRTWNLINGKSAFVSNIKEVADGVFWSKDEDHYIVIINKRLDIYQVKTASVVNTVEFTSRIASFVFITDNKVAVSIDDGRIYVCDILYRGRTLLEFKACDTRVKSLAYCHYDGTAILIGATSSGFIKVWNVLFDIKKSKKVAVNLLTEIDTKFRLTCLAVSKPNMNTDDNMEDATTGTISKTESKQPDKGSEVSTRRSKRKISTNNKSTKMTETTSTTGKVTKKKKKHSTETDLSTTSDKYLSKPKQASKVKKKKTKNIVTIVHVHL